MQTRSIKVELTVSSITLSLIKLLSLVLLHPRGLLYVYLGLLHNPVTAIRVIRPIPPPCMSSVSVQGRISTCVHSLVVHKLNITLGRRLFCVTLGLWKRLRKTL